LRGSSGSRGERASVALAEGRSHAAELSDRYQARRRRCARRAGTRWAVRIVVVALLLAIAVVAVLLLLTVV
jgi:uncharacterized membrane protein YdfJ with MMPL/SSD domain